MPFYYRLRIRSNDSAETRAYKRRVAKKLLELRSALAEHIENSVRSESEMGERHSHDSSRLLRLATWNIREFDSNKFGLRLEESFYYIAEILSNFDLIAIQEVRQNVAALRKVIRILGPSWNYIATDVTKGSGGNNERMAFVYNENKVLFRSVAGELVLDKSNKLIYPHEERLSFQEQLALELPKDTTLDSPTEVQTRKRNNKHFLTQEVGIDLPSGTLLQLPPDCQVVLPTGYEVKLRDENHIVLPKGTKIAIKETGKDKRAMVKLPKGAIVGDELQFARTPSLVAFQAGWLKINLCTVHIYYGSDKQGLERRKNEIRQLTKILADRAKNDKDSDSDSFFVALGDFNIIDKKHETMKALLTNGFEVPAALQTLEGTNVDRSKAYDQIAYWTDPDGTSSISRGITQIEVHRAGVFDFFNTVFREGESDPEGEDERIYRSMPSYKPTWKYKDWRTYQMSDHLPMWVELRTDFGNEYLQQICDHPES